MMKENEVETKVMEFAEMLPAITGAAGGLLSAGVFKGPIKSLQDIWDCTIGYPIQKLKVRREVALEKYRESILKKVVGIPEENLQEPKLSILGPALEASKYYIEEESLRDMFAKLVASSMDSTKAGSARTAFVETIKQMNPLDAEILSQIYCSDKNVNENSIAKIVGRVEIESKKNGSHIQRLGSHLYFGSQDKIRIIEQEENREKAIAIENLARLGIIEIDYDSILLDVNYKLFEQLAKSTIEYTIAVAASDENESAQIRMGNIDITDYGRSFCSICL